MSSPMPFIVIGGMMCLSSSVGAALMMGGGEEDGGGGGGEDETVPNVLTDPVGSTIRCSANDVMGLSPNDAAYRYMGGDILRQYPNSDVASSWNPNWENSNSVDCEDLTAGDPLTYKEGTPIRCSANDPLGLSPYDGAYRHMGGTVLRQYPNSDVARSWDPNWETTMSIDCTGLTAGDPMAMKP